MSFELSFKLVEFFLIGVGIAFLVFELALNLNDVEGDNSNRLLLHWSKGEFIFIPFAFGAIIGHLFLGTQSRVIPEDLLSFISTDLLVVVILFILSGGLWMLGRVYHGQRTTPLLMILLLLGIFYGHFIWSMFTE